METIDTFRHLQKLVHQVLPNAEVYLFGSRANNTAHSESDWDLLILEKGIVDKDLKNKVFDVLYPYSVQLETFIHFVLVNKDEWQTHPRFYSLHLSINQNPVIA